MSLLRMPRVGDLWEMTHVVSHALDLYIVTGYTRCQHDGDTHTLDCIVQLVFLSDLEESITYTVSEMLDNDALASGAEEDNA